MGRWSRLVAPEFLDWLDVDRGSNWLDVGCGTGILTLAILANAAPASVRGTDPSEGFVQYAQEQIADRRATFGMADAQATGEDDAAYDAVVSGLVLNFVKRPEVALTECFRVAKPGGTVGAYVWDYGEKMEMTRYFWNGVVALDADATELDQGNRFPICDPSALDEHFRASGLVEIDVRSIDIPTVFVDFEDYWLPFLGGQGGAPTYLAALSDEKRTRLREHIREALPVEPDGSIELVARSWAAKGRKPA